MFRTRHVSTAIHGATDQPPAISHAAAAIDAVLALVAFPITLVIYLRSRKVSLFGEDVHVSLLGRPRSARLSGEQYGELSDLSGIIVRTSAPNLGQTVVPPLSDLASSAAFTITPRIQTVEPQVSRLLADAREMWLG